MGSPGLYIIPGVVSFRSAAGHVVGGWFDFSDVINIANVRVWVDCF